MSYRQLHLALRFLTPAFLGDAEQNGRWRTPPIKAQLRQWWRAAYAADKYFSVDLGEMRREEGLLFGNAWLSHREDEREVVDHRKSLVRLRLSRWDEGQQKSWQGLEQGTVYHPEVERTKYRVGPHAYLAYGALDGRGGTQFDTKRSAAIQVNESALLSIAFPITHDDPRLRRVAEENVPRIERAIALANLYGTLGGRSRNGWGSFHLTPADDRTPRLAATPLPLRPWRDCLNREWDWAHAIGRDDKGPLIWQTAPHADWKSLLKTLAVVKIGLRTQFVFPNAKPPHAGIEPRHWLSYPITTHTTRAWDRGARLPNQLRFKVRAMADSKLVGVLVLMPHLPPPAFNPDRAAIQLVWEKVHALLDELRTPASGRSYSMIADAARRASLKPHLDTVVLEKNRSPE